MSHDCERTHEIRQWGSMHWFEMADIIVQYITVKGTKVGCIPQPYHHQPSWWNLPVNHYHLGEFHIFFPFIMRNVITNDINHLPRSTQHWSLAQYFLLWATFPAHLFRHSWLFPPQYSKMAMLLRVLFVGPCSQWSVSFSSTELIFNHCLPSIQKVPRRQQVFKIHLQNKRLRKYFSNMELISTFKFHLLCLHSSKWTHPFLPTLPTTAAVLGQMTMLMSSFLYLPAPSKWPLQGVVCLKKKEQL